MEDLYKYVLLLILALPLIALTFDARGTTRGAMIIIVVASAIASTVLAFGIGGLYQRPNVANIYVFALAVWPIAVLVAKGFNPALRWSHILTSIPIMSWYLVNLSMQFYYPTNGGGGGLGFAFGMLFGWSYMVIPFAPLAVIFIGVRAIVRRARSRRGGSAKSTALRASP